MVVLDDLIERRVRDAARGLAHEGRVRAVFVFGSRVLGGADAWSDIDIAAFVEGAETWDLRRRARTAVSIQKQFGDDLELHFFPARALDHCQPGSFAEYLIRNGVRVSVDEM